MRIALACAVLVLMLGDAAHEPAVEGAACLLIVDLVRIYIPANSTARANATLLEAAGASDALRSIGASSPAQLALQAIDEVSV